MADEVKKPRVRRPKPAEKQASPGILAIPKVTPDWKAYYLAFQKMHEVEGGGPVLYGDTEGVWLFGDGWRYSATDYAGPEFPPPEDERELIELQRFYWRRRRAIVHLERGKLSFQLEGIRKQERERETPLFAMKYLVSELTGLPTRDPKDPSVEIDDDWWHDALHRLQWLNDDHDLCSLYLKGLGEE